MHGYITTTSHTHITILPNISNIHPQPPHTQDTNPPQPSHTTIASVIDEIHAGVEGSERADSLWTEADKGTLNPVRQQRGRANNNNTHPQQTMSQLTPET